MRKVMLISILIISQFVYCANKQKKIRQHITNGNLKYWYRYYNDTLKPYALGYSFDENGTYVQYCNPGYNSKVRAFCISPNSAKPVWDIISDSILMFGQGVYYSIVAINDNDIILKPVNSLNGGYLRLHRDLDQTTKPKLMKLTDSTDMPTL